MTAIILSPSSVRETQEDGVERMDAWQFLRTPSMGIVTAT